MSAQKTEIMQRGEVMHVESNAENIGINFNVSELLALQAKYTELQCECKRFLDWILNMSKDCRAVSIIFDDDYLQFAAREICSKFRIKTAEEKDAEQRALRARVEEIGNNTLKK